MEEHNQEMNMMIKFRIEPKTGKKCDIEDISAEGERGEDNQVGEKGESPRNCIGCRDKKDKED